MAEYALKFTALKELRERIAQDEEIHPIEISYMNNLVAGMKPKVAMGKRKHQYRAAAQRRIKADQRSEEAQHRDRELMGALDGLSKNELYDSDVVDEMLETLVVTPTGEAIETQAEREAIVGALRRLPVAHGSIQDKIYKANTAEVQDYSAALFQLKQG